MEPDITDSISNLIALANDAFGDNQWSHKIINQVIDFARFNNNSYSVGCQTIIEIKLMNSGLTHTDFGYYESSEHTEAEAHFKARMVSNTNAFRKTLYYFLRSKNLLMNKNSRKHIFETNCTEEQRNARKRRIAKAREAQLNWKRKYTTTFEPSDSLSSSINSLEISNSQE